MPSVCLYLHTHQPLRLRKFSFFDIGKNQQYFDEERNRHYLGRIIKKSYLPTNKILFDLIKDTKGEFKVSFSLTGVFLEQLEQFSKETLDSFKKIIDTGSAEIIAETYYHSLAYLYSKEEFKEQIEKHKTKIREIFKVTPKIFRNTELMFNNEMAGIVEGMGYKAVLAEGADHILGWQSPNFVYKIKNTDNLKVLLRNYRLSDDISFRFSRKDWASFPLTAEKFASWISEANGQGQVINLFMDYETFGEHQWEDTGIFEFLKNLPYKIFQHPDNNFKTPSEVIKLYKPLGELDFPHIVTWADTERDLSAWLGNKMQQSAVSLIYSLEKEIKEIKNPEIIDIWRKLQTSDHFYYMCTKWFSDGDVHKYFSPYDSPYDAFIIFMNIFNDLKLKVNKFI